MKAQVSARLTGFAKGAICPVGMNTAIPVILSDRLLQLDPPFLWLGGGHVCLLFAHSSLASHLSSVAQIDVKLGCSVAEFIKATNCYVADVVHDGDTDVGDIVDD